MQIGEKLNECVTLINILSRHVMMMHFLRLISTPWLLSTTEKDVGEVKDDNTESFQLMKCPQVWGNSNNEQLIAFLNTAPVNIPEKIWFVILSIYPACKVTFFFF